MDRSFNEIRGRYNGPAEIWFDDVKQFEVTIQLTRYVEVTEITTFGGVSHLDGVNSWDGRIVGLCQNDLMTLAVRTFQLKMPDGEERQAVLPNGDSYLRGTGMPPFG